MTWYKICLLSRLSIFPFRYRLSVFLPSFLLLRSRRGLLSVVLAALAAILASLIHLLALLVSLLQIQSLIAKDGKATAYVCQHFACSLPTQKAEDLAASLS